MAEGAPDAGAAILKVTATYPLFSILTPVRNARAHLPACVESVADQAGPPREHIILDGGSTDGTVEWLRSLAPAGERVGNEHVVRWVSGEDRGMYDALNRGLDLARGDWIGWLNADEQYLEGALNQVARAAARRPDVDLWFGDWLIVDGAGACLAWRRPASPGWMSIAATHLYLQSCAMFFHRRLIEAGARFDARWRIVGDEAFVVDLLRRGARAGRIRAALAAFTMTGRNLGLGPEAETEARRLKREWPAWLRLMRVPLRLGVWLRRFAVGGCVSPRQVVYRLYMGDPPIRRMFESTRPPWRWPGGRPANGGKGA